MASRHDRIAQDDIDLVASPENEIRTERDICGRRSLDTKLNRWGSPTPSRPTDSSAPDAEGQSDWPDLDLVPGLERGPTGNTVPVDRSATLAAKVLNEPGFILEQNPAMPPRYFWMAQDQVDLRGAANHDIFTAQQLRAWREPGKNGDRRFQS